MKRRKWYEPIVVVGSIILVVGISTTVMNAYLDNVSEKAQKEAVEEYRESQEAEDSVINVPEPCTEGYLTVFDSEGATHFQYSGSISIENDGKNGRPIEIYVYVSPEDPAYNLP